MQSFVRVAAENTVRVAGLGICQRALCNLVAQAQPACTEAVKPARHFLLFTVQALRHLVEPFEEPAQQDVAIDKAVELVAVDGQVAFPAIFPYKSLIDRNAHHV